MVSQLCHQLERQLRSARPTSFLESLEQLPNLGKVEQHYLLATACELLPDEAFGSLQASGSLPPELLIYQDGSVLPGDETYFAYPWTPAAYRRVCTQDEAVRTVLPGRFAQLADTVEIVEGHTDAVILLAA